MACDDMGWARRYNPAHPPVPHKYRSQARWRNCMRTPMGLSLCMMDVAKICDLAWAGLRTRLYFSNSRLHYTHGAWWPYTETMGEDDRISAAPWHIPRHCIVIATIGGERDTTETKQRSATHHCTASPQWCPTPTHPLVQCSDYHKAVQRPIPTHCMPFTSCIPRTRRQHRGKVEQRSATHQSPTPTHCMLRETMSMKFHVFSK